VSGSGGGRGGEAGGGASTGGRGGGPAAAPGEDSSAAPAAPPGDEAQPAPADVQAAPSVSVSYPSSGGDDDHTTAYLLAGVGVLAAILGGGWAWYRRRPS